MRRSKLISGEHILDVVRDRREYPTKTQMRLKANKCGYDEATFRLAVADWWYDEWPTSSYRSQTCRLIGPDLTRSGYLDRIKLEKAVRKAEGRLKGSTNTPASTNAKPKRTTRTNIAKQGGFALSDLMMDQACLCVCCGKDLIASGDYQLDHIQPFSKGGRDEYWNLQFLCWPCNISKRDKDPFVWAAQTGTKLPEKFLSRFEDNP